MRDKYRRCLACGEYHWLSAWPANHIEPEVERSPLSSPYYVSDQIADLWHPSDGHRYDSKSEFRKVTKQHGGEEVGTEVQADNRRMNEVTEAEVAKAYQMVSQGYKPAPVEASSDDMQTLIN